MIITRKEMPELFTKEMQDFIVEDSYNEHRRGSTFFRKSIIEIKEEDREFFENIKDFQKCIGFWETNEYIWCEDDFDWSEVDTLTKVKPISKKIEVRVWVADDEPDTNTGR